MPTIAGSSCPACRSTFRLRTRCICCRRPPSAAALRGRSDRSASSSGSRSSATTRSGTSPATYEAEGDAQPEDGPVRRAHDAPGRAVVELQRNMSFNSDGGNPSNTNVGFANALTGSVTEYTESDGHPSAHGQFLLTEWYAQDNWRVKRNLTIDAGVRFYYMTPTQSQGDQVAQFEPGAIRGLGGPTLFRPITTAQGRRAVNPLTGEILPATVHRAAGAELRELHQRHGGLQRDAPAEVAIQGRAAPGIRLGRDRRRPDGRPRRGRRVLRSVSRRHRPRPHRAAAGPQHLQGQLHDDSALLRAR